jgi:hypothetical protein
MVEITMYYFGWVAVNILVYLKKESSLFWTLFRILAPPLGFWALAYITELRFKKAEERKQKQLQKIREENPIKSYTVERIGQGSHLATCRILFGNGTEMEVQLRYWPSGRYRFWLLPGHWGQERPLLEAYRGIIKQIFKEQLGIELRDDWLPRYLSSGAQHSRVSDSFGR